MVLSASFARSYFHHSVGKREVAAKRFREVAPSTDCWSLRLVEDALQSLSVRQGVPEPGNLILSRGARVTVVCAGVFGYAATSDLSSTGPEEAARCAAQWAERTAWLALFKESLPAPHPRTGRILGPEQPWGSMST